MNARLRIRDLHTPLVGPVALNVPAGACAAVTGPSGSGKSLFLRMISDLDPNEGRIELDGRARASFTPTQWRKTVIYVAAEAGWWTDKVADHFEPAHLAEAGRLIEALGLARDLLDATVLRLSTGERQRLAIVRALVLGPSVLLLDEPTSALDQASTAHVEGLLRRLMQEGTAMVLVTHDLALAERLGTSQYRMAHGRLAPA